MTLADWLYFLDTSSRVQCPEITAQQAAELAGLLREMERTERRHANEWADMHDACAQRDERVEILEAKVVFWKARALASSPVAIAAPDFDASDPTPTCPMCRKDMKPDPRIDKGWVCYHKTIHVPPVTDAAPDFDASDYERPGKVKP